PLRVFLTVANDKSFSRAAEKLLRTQPAISLSIQRLETELGEKLIDRSAKDLLLTDAGRIVLDYARRFENLQGDLENALTELRDKSAGRLIIGANESAALYLLDHIERYRRAFPKIKVQIRRAQSSKIPSELIDGELELGILTYDPEDERVVTKVIYTDHLSFIVSPKHRLAGKAEISIAELARETFIAHNVVSPYRAQVIRTFQNQKVPLNMSVEMPTVEAIRKMVERNEGVAFLPRMCVEDEVKHGILKEVKVTGMQMAREIRLAYPARRALSHAAQAFLQLVE
ncbi:MAG TPA: LysR family transcriptional regulator, partial [Bryobacteraceae bacterium]|nr:LysR family transcriptional regulator [Bryobacteraceae bacterium]